jgi:putative SOS response-associated peptidase YedK
MPTPPLYLVDAKGIPKKSDSGVTNIRNTRSSHWRRWLGTESRCLAPFSSFSENEFLPNGSRPPIWFSLGEDRPLVFFAGIWTRWKSVRKVKEGETTNDIFSFLTTERNALIGMYRRKAMPVILTTQDEVDTWVEAPTPIALQLRRALTDDALAGVAPGAKQDGGAQGSEPGMLV